MPDFSNVAAALIAKLEGDATLMALMTGGVYRDVAKSGKTKFVIVSFISGIDTYVFEGSALEEHLYLVKAVSQDSSGLDVKTAAARIHTLLQDVQLTITGYSHQLTRREEPIAYTEIDGVDNAISWQHRGGRYRVVVSP